MGSIVIDMDTKDGLYTVVGVLKNEEFVISGPWSTRDLAESHAEKIVSILNEAVQEMASKKPIILQ